MNIIIRGWNIELFKKIFPNNIKMIQLQYSLFPENISFCWKKFIIIFFLETNKRHNCNITMLLRKISFYYKRNSCKFKNGFWVLSAVCDESWEVNRCTENPSNFFFWLEERNVNWWEASVRNCHFLFIFYCFLSRENVHFQVLVPLQSWCWEAHISWWEVNEQHSFLDWERLHDVPEHFHHLFIILDFFWVTWKSGWRHNCKNDSQFMFKYGMMLYISNEVNINKKEAVKYFLNAADKGLNDSTYKYAMMLFNGEEVTADKKEVAK